MPTEEQLEKFVKVAVQKQDCPWVTEDLVRRQVLDLNLTHFPISFPIVKITDLRYKRFIGLYDLLPRMGYIDYLSWLKDPKTQHLTPSPRLLDALYGLKAELDALKK